MRSNRSIMLGSLVITSPKKTSSKLTRFIIRSWQPLTFYARPFGRSRLSGSITSQIVPPKFLPLHRRTIEIRNQLIAHLDADASEFVGEPGNRVILEIMAGHVSIHPRRILMDRAEILKLSELASVLMDRVDKQMDQLCDRHKELFPAIDGKYVIDLRKQMFVPYSPS